MDVLLGDSPHLAVRPLEGVRSDSWQVITLEPKTFRTVYITKTMSNAHEYDNGGRECQALCKRKNEAGTSLGVKAAKAIRKCVLSIWRHAPKSAQADDHMTHCPCH
jgi:hypothetical protein